MKSVEPLTIVSARKNKSKKIYITIWYIFVYIFALIGLFFTLVFIGMQFGWFNVRGSASMRNQFFKEAREQIKKPTSTNSQNQNTNASTTASLNPVDTTSCGDHAATWICTEEWATVSAGLLKDLPVITRVSKETGVPVRLIAAVAVPEQLRFFGSEREVFKRYFEPLKVLGSLSQFSLGVTGIKPETALRIETYAKASTDSRYPGPGYAKLLAYPTGDGIDSERYARLTNEKDHYYSYLYSAIFLKEIMTEWERAGYSISENPGVLVTLFNLGFDHSRPNPTPKIGGATITVGNESYTYGEIGALFYTSGELVEFK